MPPSARAVAGRMIRRLGLLPGGLPDGLGEDDSLAEVSLGTTVAVFFPDPPENLYQLRQWYEALEVLHQRVGVTIILQDSRTARAVRSQTGLPVVVAALTRTVGRLLADGAVRVVLYVGQSNANAVGLRVPSVIHVFLNHGDSDKYVSVSNQVKAFDFAFVAGQAGVDRHAAGLMLFDSPNRVRVVGRPQLPARTEPGSPTTVLYCPTWEGTLAVNAYSSVKAYGAPIVEAILADPGLHLIYRPHPRTGASDRTYGAADRHIREIIARHPDRARTDTAPSPAESLGQAHVAIADVSAIGTDWLAQRRPLISTVPAHPDARIARPARIFERTPHISAATATESARIVRDTLDDPDALVAVDELFAYYLGGMDGAAATQAFVDACVAAARVCDERRAHLGTPS